jgi:hypothetical protein
MKLGNLTNLFILFFILIVLGLLYRRFEDKRMREENKDNYNAIQDYLLDDITLGKSKKPILWIHVPYEYNSRKWLSFGSRSSFELNQPYLYLTVRSIIKHCENSFTICIFDDNTFSKLIPGWNIDMNRLSDPIISNMRVLGMMKLLYIYGGMICPISFLCMKNLLELYSKGTRGNKMFICETIDRNSTSSNLNFYPSISFCGAPKECEVVAEFCNYIQIVSSHDHTTESKFLGQFDRWCMKKVSENKINLIDGMEIGTKTINDKQIILDDLMSNNYLDLYKGTNGILIPSNDLLNRLKFAWFIRMSQRQVLESDTIIGNYLLLSVGPEQQQGILEPLQVKPNWVGFWKTPNYPGLYGLKPNFLGDNLNKLPHTGR